MDLSGMSDADLLLLVADCCSPAKMAELGALTDAELEAQSLACAPLLDRAQFQGMSYPVLEQWVADNCDCVQPVLCGGCVMPPRLRFTFGGFSDVVSGPPLESEIRYSELNGKSFTVSQPTSGANNCCYTNIAGWFGRLLMSATVGPPGGQFTFENEYIGAGGDLLSRQLCFVLDEWVLNLAFDTENTAGIILIRFTNPPACGDIIGDHAVTGPARVNAADPPTGFVTVESV